MTIRDTYADDFDGPAPRKRRKKSPPKKRSLLGILILVTLALLGGAYVVYLSQQ